MNELSAKDRLIVALDVNTIDEVKRLVDILRPHVELFKIGFEAFTTIGPQVIEVVHDLGGEVFLDLMLRVIPETMKKTALSPLGFRPVKMHSIHTSANRKAIRAAAQNKEESTLLGVTPFISHSFVVEPEVGRGERDKTVLHLARVLVEEGADGVYCSAREARLIKSKPKLGRLTLVTPATRTRWSDYDQYWLSTPTEAIEAGADYVVVGRPIRNPPQEIGSPADAAKRIIDEMAHALTK